MSRRRLLRDELPACFLVGIDRMERDRHGIKRERKAVQRSAQSFAGRLDEGFLQGPETKKDIGLLLPWCGAQYRDFRSAEEAFRNFEVSPSYLRLDIDPDVAADTYRASDETPRVGQVESDIGPANVGGDHR